MDTPSTRFPGGGIRVSDAERDQAIAELSEHFQAGRLTQEEFEDRSGRALRARTGSDLGELFADLPPRGTTPAPQAGGQAAEPGLACRLREMSLARAIILGVIVTIVAANLLAGVSRTGVGWLVPVVILGCVFARLGRRR
jgi:Domain of unknown function (DUF1707)